jgi:hypothetical protein
MLLLKHWPYSGAGDLPRKVVRAKGQAGLVGSALKSNCGKYLQSPIPSREPDLQEYRGEYHAGFKKQEFLSANG